MTTASSRPEGLARRVLTRVPAVFSPSQVAVRAVGAVTVVTAVSVAGTHTWLLVLVVVAALFAAVFPEPFGAAVSLVAVVLAWVLGQRDVASWTTPALALGVLVEHTCIVLATCAPPHATLGRTIVVRGVRRAIVVAVATTLLWAGLAHAPRGGVPAVVIVGAVAVTLVAAYTLRSPTQEKRR